MVTSDRVAVGTCQAEEVRDLKCSIATSVAARIKLMEGIITDQALIVAVGHTLKLFCDALSKAYIYEYMAYILIVVHGK